jgi:hypothetical protein
MCNPPTQPYKALEITCSRAPIPLTGRFIPTPEKQQWWNFLTI